VGSRLDPLTFAALGAAILVLLCSNSSATAEHLLNEKETNR
jgi:hypothetical protein